MDFKTATATWRISEGFDGFVGPGHISHVFGPHGKAIIEDDPTVRTQNDERASGLFSVGVIVAAPHPSSTAENFWTWAWEATGRYGGPGAGFGASHYAVRRTSDYSARAEVVYSILDRPLMTVRREYNFISRDASPSPLPRDAVQCKVEVECYPFPGVYAKEPKIVCGSIRGADYVQCADARGKPLERPFNLHYLHSSRAHTHQIPYPERRRVRVTTGIGGWVFDCDNGFDAWRAQADASSDDLSHLLPSPRYCSNGRALNARWEVPHSAGDSRAGVFFHAWEGGYGAPDCGVCYRPWPGGSIFRSVLTAEREPHLLLS